MMPNVSVTAAVRPICPVCPSPCGPPAHPHACHYWCQLSNYHTGGAAQALPVRLARRDGHDLCF